MRKNYREVPGTVKDRYADLRHSCPLLWSLGKFLFNALPFALIWLAAGWNMFVAALAAFLMALIHFMRENYLRNRRLSEMARKARERGDA